MRYAVSLLIFCGALCQAQDRAEVLATSVRFSTLAATRPPAPEVKAETDKLRQRAMVASQEGRYGDALRDLLHGMSLLQGVAWTPAVETATSIRPRLDHAIWQPGDKVHIQLLPVFTPESPVALPASAQLKASSRTRELGSWSKVSHGWETRIIVPEIAPGKYTLLLRLGSITKELPVLVQPGLRDEIQSIQARTAKLAVKPDTALWTLQYIPQLFERADTGEAEATRFDFRNELRYAHELLRALESGVDPFASRTGDMRRAYRSEVDNSLQPYRLYVPRSYDRSRAHPLLVALHGMGGDENTLFDRYGSPALQQQAEKHGYLVVCPKGRGPASMYQGTAEQDVLDVLEEVRRAYNINTDRVYLAGHSMGAYGTWSIAMNHPTVFAALAPVAGGGNPARMVAIRHIPQLVVHGENDKTVPVTASRIMVEAAQRLEAPIKYLEIPGGGHVDVFVPAVPEMFSWFNTHTKAGAASAAASSN